MLQFFRDSVVLVVGNLLGTVPILTHYIVKMSLNSHKLGLFTVIEQILNFPVIYDYAYSFLLHLVKNMSQMGQKWTIIHKFVTGIILV